jgi:DNA polymerase-3 subunit epsilon
MNLFFDTETSGKADFRAAPDAPHQPRLVQLAAILVDDAAKEIASLNLIISPDGFEIPKEASDIHGITTERAQAVGVPLQYAVWLFGSLFKTAQTIVAHNISFDLLVMQGECCRVPVDLPMRSKERFCTMQAMTPVCKLPGKFGNDYKWPKLQEAHIHAFGKEFEGAHDALADVRACRDLFFWLRDRKAVSA